MNDQENSTFHLLEVNNLENEPMNKRIITKCDESFLMQVEQDLIDIIILQKLRFRIKILKGIFSPFFMLSRIIDRWWSLVRKILLILSIIVVLILLYKIFFEKFEWILLTLFTIHMTVIFSLLFSKTSYSNKDNNKLANLVDRKSAKLSAKKILRIANNVLPFDACYNFSSNLMTCHRLKDKNSIHVFSKELEKFAVVHNHATLFYKNSTSVSDQIITMHDDPQQIIDILERLDIEFIIYTSELYDNLLKELDN